MGKPQIAIRFGALAPKLKVQVKEQGYKYPHQTGIDFFQLRADQITGLHLTSILTEAEARKARQRLLKRLIKTLASL